MSDKLLPPVLPVAPGSSVDVPQDRVGAVVPLPPLPGISSASPENYFRPPAPLLLGHGNQTFLTETPDEMFSGPEMMAVTPGAGGEPRSQPWRPPPGAYRVGSFVRNHRLCIHQRGCTKCREEGVSVFRRRSMSRGRGTSSQRRGGKRSTSRSRRGKRSGSSRRSPRKKCSSLCVHPPIRTRRSSSRRGRRSGSGRSRRSPRAGKSAGIQTDDGVFPLPHGSEIDLNIKRLTVYHNHDFSQMTWEELMALLTTNFRQCAELSELQILELEKIKAEVLEMIEAGRVRVKDPRLKWKNREMMLSLQLTHLSRARDIYQAVWEALSEHNAHLRRLPTLLEVRAFREVHSFNTDFLGSGRALLRFTDVPGRLCRGINLYQACLALVVGRRWVLLVLRRRLRRISEQTQEVNTAIDAVLQYKFQKLPAEKVRVSILLTKLDDLTRWFEDVKSKMLQTVQSLYAELEARRQQQVEETIVATMDAEVDAESDWKHLYDFNRCLARLVENVSERNARLKTMIEETRSGARRRTKDDEEWQVWLLQQRLENGRQERVDKLNISRTRWLPV